MNNKQNGVVAKASIVFYVVSVIFLFITAFIFYMTYETVVAYQASYTTTWKDIIGLYFTNVAPYFAYAFILYGIGVILKKFAVMTDTLTSMMDQAIEENEEPERVFFEEDDNIEAVEAPTQEISEETTDVETATTESEEPSVQESVDKETK